MFSVPPDEPVIRNQNGQEMLTYEIGPYEVGQNLILDCEVSGGKCDQLLEFFYYFHVNIQLMNNA